MVENLHGQVPIGRELTQLGLDGIVRQAGKGFGVWLTEAEKNLGGIKQEWVSSVAALARKGRKVRFADAGCGNGNAAIPFIREFAQLRYGVEAQLIDLQPTAITEARENIAHSRLPQSVLVGLRVGDVTDLPFASASQDGIISESVLGWLGAKENIDAALRSFTRVLTPGGYAYLNVMTPYNRSCLVNIGNKSTEERLSEVQETLDIHPDEPYLFHNPKYTDEFGQPRPVLYLTEPALSRMLASVGLTVVQSEYVRNKKLSNGLNDIDPLTASYKFPENLSVIARKINHQL